MSMPGDGDCFFNAVSCAIASVWPWSDSPTGASLRRQVVQYYRSAPQTEILTIEDVMYCTSLRDRVNELANINSQHPESYCGTLVELYVISIITGISFNIGYCYTNRVEIETTTISPLFTTPGPTATTCTTYRVVVAITLVIFQFYFKIIGLYHFHYLY